LLVGDFLVSDVGADRFFVTADGRDEVTAGLELVAKKIPHLAFDILRDPYRTFPFHIPDDLRHRILRRDRYQHVDVIRHLAVPQEDSMTSFPQL
jgi:hypothetical protein